jgi:hypothetical protein
MMMMMVVVIMEHLVELELAWETVRYLSVYLWLYSPLLKLGRCFSFFIFYKVGRTPWTGDQPVARPLTAHRTAQTQNKGTQTSMRHVGFEPTIPVFEREKAVHALDREAIVIGKIEVPTRRKHAPMQLCPQTIPRDLNLD